MPSSHGKMCNSPLRSCMWNGAARGRGPEYLVGNYHFIDIGNRSVYMEIPPSPPPSLIASYTHVHMLRCSPELKYHARKDAPTTMAAAGK